MSVLMEFALEAGLIEHNPVRDVKKIAAKPDGFHTWTVAESPPSRRGTLSAP